MSLKVKERKVQLPVQMMRAEFSPASFDKEARTIELTWSVGAKGLRGYYDPYYEELSMDPAHVRMGRLTSGNTPFCDNHELYMGNRAVLGKVLSAKVAAGVGSAVVRLEDPANLENVDAKDTIRKIESGTLVNISVGYIVYRYERQPMAEGEEIPTYLAVDWEPTELSIVPVGFDQSAVVRGKETDTVTCVFSDKIEDPQGKEAHVMTEEQKREMERKQAEEAKALADKAEADKKLAVEQARALEKARHAEIRKIVSSVKLPVEIAERAITDDKTVEQVRELVIVELAKISDDQVTRNANGSVITGGKPALLGERKLGLENAIMHRASPGVVALTDAGREFRALSLLEMARDFLEAAGIRTRGMTKMELATRAFHTSSDFPEVLANVANKTLRRGYDEAPRTFQAWAKRATMPDFKQVSRTQLGGAPALELVLENGEIKRGTIGEGAEKYQLATYAKIFGISRQALINDDLNAFAVMPSMFGNSAASLESDVVYAILTANANLADGVPLLHSTHKNVGTGGVPSVTTLGEFRKLMRLQTGIEGRTLNLMLKFLIAPAALETLIDQLVVQTTQPALDSSTNPFKGKLIPVIEPRLDANSAVKYYGAVDPNSCDTVEYGYLEGQEGVYSESRMGFDVDGMEIKARLDFAAKAIDYRGLTYNAGA